MQQRKRIGIIGARGHTGTELIRLVAGHPDLELAFVSSRELDGQRVAAHNPDFSGELCYQNLSPEAAAARGADAVVLALPNGKSVPFVAAINEVSPETVIVDLSADYRFDPGWYYGLPELTRKRYAGQRRIANPGCYATAMQAGDRAAEGRVGRATAMLWRFRLFGCRHHAIRAQRCRKAARQPDAVQPDRPYP